MSEKKSEKKKGENEGFRMVFNQETKEVMFLLEVNGITNYAAFMFKSQALYMAEFLLDCMDQMEDDIGKGDFSH